MGISVCTLVLVQSRLHQAQPLVQSLHWTIQHALRASTGGQVALQIDTATVAIFTFASRRWMTDLEMHLSTATRKLRSTKERLAMVRFLVVATWVRQTTLVLSTTMISVCILRLDL